MRRDFAAGPVRNQILTGLFYFHEMVDNSDKELYKSLRHSYKFAGHTQ